MFAFTALTSLLLLNFISRQFGELVGKGLPWSVIGEFFLLSIPFTVALTIPMSVLVAVLYAYSRLAAENEVTAMKANGVSPLRLVMPALGLGVFMSVGLLAFNDQVLPRANHRLKTLQEDIAQTKPTLLLKDQVINPIAEGKFYLKASKIDQSDGSMKEVVIFDLANPMQRRTIYASTGKIEFAANKIDVDLTLFNGQMQEVDTDKPTQLNRLFYKQDRIRIRDVGRGGDFKTSKPSASSKGDREMSVCEMQKQYWRGNTNFQAALHEYELTKVNPEAPPTSAFPVIKPTLEPHGLGWAYCTLLKSVFGVNEAQAAEVPRVRQDTASKKRDTAAKTQDTTKKKADTTGKKGAPAASVMTFEGGRLVGAPIPGQLRPVPGAIEPAAVSGDTAKPVAPAFAPSSGMPAQDTGAAAQTAIAARAAAAMMRANLHEETGPMLSKARVMEAKTRLELAERGKNRYEIEIHKKFSLALACLIFCIVAPPLALRFPRGGVGFVIGVSLIVFALYYVGLIGGEALANKGLMPPFWAMWGTNAIMTLIGIVLLLRMGRESGSGRGGGLREWFDNRRARREDAAAVRRVI